MQIIDLYSGIGGFSLAGYWAGWRTVQFCEIDKFCQRVLTYHWPDVPIHDDINTLTVEQVKNNKLYDKDETTIVVGGFPCQPWSVAGKRKGTEDNRNLWPQTIRFIKVFKPDWAVLENVPRIISWDGGVVFNQIITDLENAGYTVQTIVLPACAVNAPHKRDRVWIVAHNGSRYAQQRNASASGSGKRIIKQRKTTGSGTSCRQDICTRTKETRDNSCRFIQDKPGTSPDTDKFNGNRTGFCTSKISQLKETKIQRFITSNTKSKGLERGNRIQEPIQSEQGNKQDVADTDSSNFPTQSPLCGRDDGVSFGLVDITFSKWRNESIKCLGNSVVSQVVLQIFKVINKIENEHK